MTFDVSYFKSEHSFSFWIFAADYLALVLSVCLVVENKVNNVHMLI